MDLPFNPSSASPSKWICAVNLSLITEPASLEEKQCRSSFWKGKGLPSVPKGGGRGHSDLSCSDLSSRSSFNFFFYVFAVLEHSCLICQLLIRELIRDLMPGKVASLKFVSYQLQCYLPLWGFECFIWKHLEKTGELKWDFFFFLTSNVVSTKDIQVVVCVCVSACVCVCVCVCV